MHAFSAWQYHYQYHTVITHAQNVPRKIYIYDVAALHIPVNTLEYLEEGSEKGAGWVNESRHYTCDDRVL